MVQLSEMHALGDLETSEVTIKQALDVQEQSWHEVIDQRSFRIPEYQRNYSWEKSHRNDFFSTLKDQFIDLQPVPSDLDELSDLVGMYMGAVYVAEPSEESEYDELDIVDGQQRLSTFQLLLKALFDYCSNLESEAESNNRFELKADLSTVKTKLGAAFSGTSPSVVMNSEDEEFFKALAAHPDSWQMSVREVMLDQISEYEDSNLDGRMRPRVKTAGEIIDMIQDPIQTGGDYDLKDLDAFSGEEDDDEEQSKLDIFIRFETSHERMFNAYKESYELVAELLDELTNGELDQKASVVMNFSSYILHAIVVDRCLITEPEPDLRLDIFQSINDKGRPLHNVDKIRARIKHRLIGEDDSGPMDVWRETLARHGGDKDEIEDMLVYYVASTEEQIDDISDARDELMNVFDRSAPENSKVTSRLTNDNAADLVTNVSEYSKYYHDIMNGEISNFSRSIDDPNRQEINRILTRVGDKIGATQWLALGPWVYMETDRKAPGTWDSSDIGDFLFAVFDAIEVVALRQSISDRSGAAIEGSYVETVQKFNNRGQNSKFESSEIVYDLANSVRNKSGDLFEDGLIDHFVKNRKWTSGATGRCVLQRTTSRYLADNDIGLSIRDYSDIHIEHILPQSPISNRDNRSESDEELGEHAWLEYFFRTYDDDEDSAIADATQTLVDEGIQSLSESDVDPDELGDDVDEDDIIQIQEEIYDRFIDDISNLLLLVDADNLENSNDLMSKKLPVISKDEYLPVVTNDFFNDGVNSNFASSDSNPMDREDFRCVAGDRDWDSDAAERVDKSWNYEVMFERKGELIYQILQHLVFDIEPEEDDDSSESAGPTTQEFAGLRERVYDAVESDRLRRVERRAF